MVCSVTGVQRNNGGCVGTEKMSAISLFTLLVARLCVAFAILDEHRIPDGPTTQWAFRDLR